MTTRQTISADDTLEEALRRLDAAQIKLLALVDKSGRVMRTVSDGDLRRGLLRGLTLSSEIGSLGGSVCAMAPVDVDDAYVERVLRERPDISALVRVDSSGRFIRLDRRRDLVAPILMSPPHIGTAESDYVARAFSDNWIAPAGPNLVAFEREFADITTRRRALALSSGTAAIHLALRVLRIQDGDTVYVSDLTFAASLQPILYERARPVLIDADPYTWNMSVNALARRLEQDAAAGALPRAIVVVHLYGQSADMRAISKVAESFNVPVVEDAAESLGAECSGKPSGSHGVLAAYSFNGNKIITTSTGGALVSDDEALIDHARYLSTQGRDSVDHYQHSEVAYNYRMSNVLAGIGLGQLELLEDRVKRRRAIFERYEAELGTLPGISFQREVAETRGNRWLTTIRLDPNIVERHPSRLMLALRSMNVESRPAWKPMHLQPLCAGYELEPHDHERVVSEEIYFQSLCLPSGSGLTEAEQSRVVVGVAEFVEGR